MLHTQWIYLIGFHVISPDFFDIVMSEHLFPLHIKEKFFSFFGGDCDKSPVGGVCFVRLHCDWSLCNFVVQGKGKQVKKLHFGMT